MNSAKKKQQLKRKALRLWFEKYLKDWCEICGKTDVLQGHHYFYRSSYGHLIFEKENHITLCRGCHFVLHTRDPKLIEKQIIEKRGKLWYNKLTKQANIRPKSSYQTLTYYQNAVRNLQT